MLVIPETTRWEWVKISERDGFETYALRPFIVTNRAFVYSHSEALWQLEEASK